MGDIELKVTTAGEKYLEFTERATKTRNGVTGGTRAYPPKMYEDPGNPRCPVQMYEWYVEKRPEGMCTPDVPFYLGIHKKSHENNDTWYVCQAMGKNTLGNLVKSMCQEAGIQGRKVNHSARKTAITALVHEGVPPTLIQQHSGHKNIGSINNYSTASVKQQQQISSVMSNISGGGKSAMSKAKSVFSSETVVAQADDNVQVTCRSSQEIIESFLEDIESFEDISYNTNSHVDVQVPFSKSTDNILSNGASFFSGATIHGNVTFTCNNAVPTHGYSKKRPRVIYSDSDSE